MLRIRSRSGQTPKPTSARSFGNKANTQLAVTRTHIINCRWPGLHCITFARQKRRGSTRPLCLRRLSASGKRWFWSARKFSEEAVFGWTDTEEQAMAAVMDAVRSLKTAPFMKAISRHECARDVLKEINEAKRRVATCAGYERCEDN